MKLKGVLTVLVSATVLAVFVGAVPAAADTFIKQTMFTDAYEMMGTKKPASYDTTETWLGKDMARMNAADNKSTILRADKNMIYMLDNTAKEYAEMPLDAFGDIAKMAQLDNDEEAAKVAEMMKAMMGAIKVTVTPTEETKKVGDWDCTRYVLEMTMPMGSQQMDMWATEDLEIDADMYRLLTSSFMSNMPGFQDMMTEMKKIKGMTVFSTGKVEMMGSEVTSSTEIIEFQKKDAPAGNYDIPEGYKKIKMAEINRMGPSQ
ncbi:MAG: DUF4412 domain-containing protein [candidate division Zixibacteria bacterium]|nr:DUF4412 domain-containing protein [candidate division Zixibacteria bacterium]